MTLPSLPTIKSVTDLRYQTAEIMGLIGRGQSVVVTRDSDPLAVMLSPKQYQQLVTLFDELEDQKATRRLEKAIAKGGQFVDFTSFDKKHRKALKLR